MAKTFETGLKKAMQRLARVVERGIHGVQKAKTQVETRGGLRPILSLESQLNHEMIDRLVRESEERIFQATLPGLTGKRTLELMKGEPLTLGKLLKLGATEAVGLDYGKGPLGKQGDVSRGFRVKGMLNQLPFQDDLFEYVTARFSHFFQEDTLRTLKELSRVMKSGSQGVIAAFHPYGLHDRKGEMRLEEQYKLCRQAGVRVVDLREVFVDETLRPLFVKEEIGLYRQLKGTPLLLFLYIYKPRK